MLSMEDVYRAHAQTVFRYLLSHTHDEALSEELTQETFYQAVKSAERFDGSCKVSTWLCSIAKNSLLSYLRKHPKPEELDETVTQSPSPESEMLAKASQVELLKHLHSLPEQTREVLYLRLFGNLSFREIGEILSRTENWARVSFYRGKELLKKELEKHGNET